MMIEINFKEIKAFGWCRVSIFPGVFVVGILLGIFLATCVDAFSIKPSPPTLRSPLAVDEMKGAEAGTLLKIDRNIASELHRYGTAHLLGFPLSRTEQVDLELEQFHITTPASLIVAGTEHGDIPIPNADITLFRGIVRGKPNSRVVLTVSQRGMQGVIDTGDGSYAFSPKRFPVAPGVQQEHVILKKSDLPLKRPAGKLPLSIYDTISSSPVLEKIPPITLPGSFQIGRLALECDYEFWTQFNDYGLALDYIYTLFAAIGDMFERDVSTKLTLTYIRIWDNINDPYLYVGGENTGLNEFRTYWTQNHNPGQAQYIERDVAHLLSSRGVGAYGWEGVLCNYNTGFSISGGNALLPTLAENLFHDIRYAGHEIGHNFNGRHTHCLIDTATHDYVDKCGVETNCNQTQDCSTAPGSIMSYCHDCAGGGNNILEEFDPVNISRIRDHVNASCLRLARNPSYIDWRNTSGTEDGTISYPYNTIKEGTEAVLPFGAVNIASGTYNETITIWQPMILQATGGAVLIGQ